MDPLLIGIDVGTSKVKVCLFNKDGSLISQESQDVNILTPLQGYAEMDLNGLFKDIIELLKCVAYGYEDYIEAIGFSVTSPTLVLMDKELNPLNPGVLYLDNRSIREVSTYVESLGGDKSYFEKVGNKPSPSTCTAALINWFKKEKPGIWAGIYKIGFLNTFLAAQFTGQVAIDPTTASYSGLMDIRKPGDWDEELIRASRVDEHVLPEIKPSYYRVGALNEKIAQSTGLKTGITVALGSADTAASSFSLGLRKHGDVFESMGTSEVLTFCLNNPDFSEAFMNRSHVLPGLWLCHGAMSTTGAAMVWLTNNIFQEFNDMKDLENEACLSVPGANGLVFLPYLSGERSPIFDSRTSGVFIGLSMKIKRADMVRAVYESAGYGIRQIYGIAHDKWNVNPEYIKCVGGAAKSSLALQVRADIINSQFVSIESDNASSYGAALLGGMAAGIYGSLDEIPYIYSFSKRVYPNIENREIYDRQFKVYESLYPNLKDTMHMLSDWNLLL